MGINNYIYKNIVASKDAPLTRQDTDKEVWLLSGPCIWSAYATDIVAVTGRHAALDACKAMLGVAKLTHPTNDPIVAAYQRFVEGAAWPVGEEIRFITAGGKLLRMTRVTTL
jgi:hypothetical protein